jgi:hypothetical protein
MANPGVFESKRQQDAYLRAIEQPMQQRSSPLSYDERWELMRQRLEKEGYSKELARDTAGGRMYVEEMRDQELERRRKVEEANERERRRRRALAEAIQKEKLERLRAMGGEALSRAREFFGR